MSRLSILPMLALAGVIGSASAKAQTVAPALAKSWAFMQEAMPGVPSSLLEAACKEGTLTVYHGTWTDAQEAQVKRFKERFPCVDVKMFELIAAQLREKFLSETRANRFIADIVQDSDPGILDNEARDGILMNYAVSNDKAYADAVKHTGFWYPLRLALVGIAWNTDKVSDAEAAKLADWKNIADPVWKGRSGVVDPSGGGVTFLPWYAWDKLYGPNFFQLVGANKPRIFGGINPAASSLASGDIAVLFNASETGLLPLLANGAPIKWSLPEPGVGPVTGQGIPAHAPHPNAAKLYQEYAFTLEGYGEWQRLGGAPARDGYQDRRDVAKESWYKYPKNFFPYDTADVTNANSRIVDAFRKNVGAFR